MLAELAQWNWGAHNISPDDIARVQLKLFRWKDVGFK